MGRMKDLYQDGVDMDSLTKDVTADDADDADDADETNEGDRSGDRSGVVGESSKNPALPINIPTKT
mgnify:CR=1 FL=1